MIKIQLTNADNGVIKTITDSKYNGADQSLDIVKVYELDEENTEEYFLKVIEILNDLSKDLGINLGGDYSQLCLSFSLDWGDKYLPTEDEVREKLKALREQTRDLKVYLSLVKKENND